MFFLFLGYDLKYSNLIKVSLRKFALRQLSIKTHDFFTDDPKAFPGDTSRCISAVQVHANEWFENYILIICSYYKIWLALEALHSH